VTFQMPAVAGLTGLALRVRDREAALRFYRDVLGLQVEAEDNALYFRPEGGVFTLTLEVDPAAPRRPPRSVGLYHFALLLPDRAALAAILRRLLESGWPLDGAGDHGVSEALYLRDPEGNGIELARDRPREEWPRVREGVAMVTEPVDIKGLLATAPTTAPLHPATTLGHMHLSVNDLESGETFYAGALGLNVTQRSYPGALFLAAGDYHHHLGLNTWGSRRPAPPGSTGLLRYGWRIPAAARAALEQHLTARGVPFAKADGALTVTDPLGIAVDLAGG